MLPESYSCARGCFITLEGGDGAGKSTQARRLVERLTTEGPRALATREPGGSPGAEAIRDLLVSGPADRWDGMTEALLMFAARRDHWVKTIAPALEQGTWVVSDRFTDSTQAYQGYGHGLGTETISALDRLVLGDVEPDLTLVLDLPVATGLGRAAHRGVATSAEDNRFERMGQGFHQRLRDGFLAIARRDAHRCVVIDATQPIDTVTEKIWQTVATRLLEPALDAAKVARR